MPTSAGTNADAVRVEIDTVLDDPEIKSLLNRVERDIDREYGGTDTTFEDTEHRQDFEATLTALRIAGGRDRRASTAASGRTQTEFEADAIGNLRRRVRQLDPGEAFGHPSTVIRDDDRNVSTTGGS